MKTACKKTTKTCRCRPPRRHWDCAYCGSTSHGDGRICGVCQEGGIDGRLLPGTGRVVCGIHRRVD